MPKILVTGGAGYIGSHTCIELLLAGHDVVVVDNLSNASSRSLAIVEKLTGQAVTFYEGDIRDKLFLNRIFETEVIESVIHFAALKAVGESSRLPLAYYDNNISGTLTLLEVMADYGCKNIIFSSSATVYGNPEIVPVTEDSPLSAVNPYGRTKLIVEEILSDLYHSDQSWNVVLLRYFNPIGAHESGELGENPRGTPNNLLPYVTQVAVGKLAEVSIFGDDYDTVDGTGVRDYIHVVDLAKGHVAALKCLTPGTGLSVYNLGTGQGYSVLEVIQHMSATVGHPIPYKIVARRPGDIATCYAHVGKAKQELGWVAEFGIERMCQDAWRWQSRHPRGFEE